MKKFFAFICSVLCLSAAGCQEKIDVTESSSETSQTSTDEVITPDEDSEEYSLGSYKVSESGIKIYNENDAVPDDIMKTLETYFTSFQNRDFDTYKTCLFPGYADNMETYLQRDYEYGLQESFESQCDNLESMAGGEFNITRIRAVPTGEENFENFFDVLNEGFGVDYYSEVKEKSDSLNDLYFSIMAEADGEETLLISDFEIVFAQKDGKYYTFG
ncbi:MAG: hypothetical protein IJ666_01120 [Ruminococcus sp.]|nr:hypothetical protein [Ruminococcus sp.]